MSTRKQQILDVVNAHQEGINGIDVATLIDASRESVSPVLSMLWRDREIKRDVKVSADGKAERQYVYLPKWVDAGFFAEPGMVPKYRKGKNRDAEKPPTVGGLLLDDGDSRDSTLDGWYKDIPKALQQINKPKAPFKIHVTYEICTANEWVEITKEQYDALQDAFDFGDDNEK